MFPACRCSPEGLHFSALYSLTVSPRLLRQRPKHPRSGRLFPRGCSPKHACGGCRLPRSFMRPSQYRKRGELRHKKREFFIKTFFKSHNFLIKRKYGKTPASGWASNLFLHQCRMQNWNWVQEFFWLWQLLLNGQVCITAGYGGGMMMVAQWLGGGRPGRRAGNGREVLWHSRVVARMGVWWGLDLGAVSPCYVAGEASVLMLCLLYGSSSRSRSWTEVESSLFKIKSWTKRNHPLLSTSYTSTLFRDINKKVN